MWAKITGDPLSTPLKARTFPSEGKGDCSGNWTFAEKWPSPTRESSQAKSASWVVEGLMWPSLHLGSPPRSSLPALLKAKVTSFSCGGPACEVEEIWPPIETLIG